MVEKRSKGIIPEIVFPMWDFLLALVAGLAQLALGVMGFRVSNKPVHTHRRRWESAFIVVGLVGLLATVWSGVRSASVEQSIESGVDKLERKLGISKGIEPPTIAVDCHDTTLPTSMPTGGLSFIDFRHAMAVQIHRSSWKYGAAWTAINLAARSTRIPRDALRSFKRREL
jgi:hypothetical protein